MGDAGCRNVRYFIPRIQKITLLTLRVLNFSGTIMVQFKSKLSLNKTKYPCQDNITHGSCLCKNSYKF
jgi:hypothetical protein